jgi:hypothetical protein
MDLVRNFRRSTTNLLRSTLGTGVVLLALLLVFGPVPIFMWLINGMFFGMALILAVVRHAILAVEKEAGA